MNSTGKAVITGKHPGSGRSKQSEAIYMYSDLLMAQRRYTPITLASLEGTTNTPY